MVRLRVSIPGADLFTARQVTISGRKAWALAALIECGNGGVTPIEHPGPRWSDYVFQLKKHGLEIETKNEGHGGAFSGTHARYVLRTAVTILETVRQQDQRKPSRSGSFQPLGAAVAVGGAQ